MIMCFFLIDARSDYTPVLSALIYNLTNNTYLLYKHGKRECHLINQAYIRYYINATPNNVTSSLRLHLKDAQLHEYAVIFTFGDGSRHVSQIPSLLFIKFT